MIIMIGVRNFHLKLSAVSIPNRVELFKLFKNATTSSSGHHPLDDGILTHDIG